MVSAKSSPLLSVACARVIICFDARGGTCRVELSVIIACIRNRRHRHLLPLLHGNSSTISGIYFIEKIQIALSLIFLRLDVFHREYQ